MGGNGVWIDRGDDDASVRSLCGVSAVAAYHTCNFGTHRLGQFNGLHQVGTDVFFQIATTHREDEQGVFSYQFANLEPLYKYTGPAVIIGARGEFRHVIGRCIAFNAHNLAEIINCMRAIACTATHTQKENTATLGFDRCQ